MNNIEIEQSRLLSLFCQLVSKDSPSLNERQVCDFLKNYLQTLGASVSEDHAAKKIGGTCGNVYACLEGTLDLPPLLFCGHMDTVEPSCGKTAIIREDGVITSNGTTVLGADNAAALACFLEAITTLKTKQIPHRPIELLISACEENYCTGSNAFDFSRIRSREAYVFDLSGPVGGAANQAPTILAFEVIVHGKTAHAGFAPEQGVHAIKAAAQALNDIPCGRLGDIVVNVGTISGGLTHNIIPNECRFGGEIRSYSDSHVLEQLEQIRTICEHAAECYGATVDVLCLSHQVIAYHTPNDHPVIQRYTSVCSSLGLPVTLEPTFGGSDNNVLAAHGITGIVVATAMNQCHTCQEYTTVEELTRAAQLALKLMASQD